MKILLLEDEEAIRDFVRINVKHNGMDMVEAAVWGFGYRWKRGGQ